MINFAIIGCGAIARKHAEAIQSLDSASLKTFVGKGQQNKNLFSREFKVDPENSIDDLLSRNDIDAVTIATPSGAHASSILPFLEKGIPVLCEKPLEISIEKVNLLIETAHKHKTILGAIHQLRMSNAAQALKKALSENKFGNIALASAYLKWWRDPEYYSSSDWRGSWRLDGGGALMNQGVHVVDLLQWFVGMPVSVHACWSKVAHETIEVEDTIIANLVFKDKTLGSIEASTACYPGASFRIEIKGDSGSAIMEDDQIIEWSFKGEPNCKAKNWNADKFQIKGGSSDPSAIGSQGHQILIEDFCHAIKERRQPLIPAVEAAKSVVLIDACYQSARSGCSISLDPILIS